MSIKCQMCHIFGPITNYCGDMIMLCNGIHSFHSLIFRYIMQIFHRYYYILTSLSMFRCFVGSLVSMVRHIAFHETIGGTKCYQLLMLLRCALHTITIFASPSFRNFHKQFSKFALFSHRSGTRRILL